ncbi:hypothetical protein B0H14DRAFT_2958281 [Mycena olivaceomarginata]|nr:hypothetical protein B0H14DRAFT_2969017 [Mycena olivaceomarginata]KAJ7785527.1 hypothetical protein B0H14DRAFT_2958281 [Mycena olivaceomarginata]
MALSRQVTETPAEVGGMDPKAHAPHTMSLSSPTLDRARIADIDAHLQRLECSMQSLRRERHSLEDRLASYKYPVLTLPNEIVSEIFVHFLPVYPKCPSPVGPESPYLLCQICRKWRDIAVATPALWKAFSLSLRRLPAELHSVSTFMARSRSCAVSVKLQDQAINHASVEEFLQAMAPHCGRLEHLEISDGTRWTLLSDFRDPLPALRALTIRTHSPDYPHQYQSYPPAVAPLLRKVSISYYNTAYTSILPWSQLTVVDLGHISLRECVHLVPRLVNVVYCRVSIMYCIHGEEMRSQQAFLPHLETLVFGGFFYKRSLAILTVPSLQWLQLPRQSRAYEYKPIAALAALISRSRCRLQELYIPDSSLRLTESQFRAHDAFQSVASFILDGGILDTAEPFLVGVDEDSDTDTEMEGSDGEEDSDRDWL